MVTGAASGIGVAISQRPATKGASVIQVDLAGTAVQQAAGSLVASGAQTLTVAQSRLALYFRFRTTVQPVKIARRMTGVAATSHSPIGPQPAVLPLAVSL